MACVQSLAKLHLRWLPHLSEPHETANDEEHQRQSDLGELVGLLVLLGRRWSRRGCREPASVAAPHSRLLDGRSTCLCHSSLYRCGILPNWKSFYIISANDDVRLPVKPSHPSQATSAIMPQVTVKQYLTLFTAAMGSLFAGSSAMHAILKPDLVRVSCLVRH